MRITAITIPHADQRYDTVGDWQFDETKCVHHINPPYLHIDVSQTGNEDYNFLIAIHELVEAWLCRKRGITDEAVTEFDKAHLGAMEPGDHPDAPYQDEHNLATGIERIVCSMLGIKWADYEAALDKLC